MDIAGTSTSGDLTGRRRPDGSRRNNTALAIASAVVSTDVSSGRVTVAVADADRRRPRTGVSVVRWAGRRGAFAARPPGGYDAPRLFGGIFNNGSVQNLATQVVSANK